MARKPKQARPLTPMHDVLYDQQMRAAFHSIYAALFAARINCPETFRGHNLTRVMTGLMGDRLWSWRVVGITPEALALFAKHDFKKPTEKGAIVRGHLHSRRRTTEQLFYRDQPLTVDEFFTVFLVNDQTVLMLPEQNPNRGDHIPKYIAIDNPDAYLFPCGSLMGYLHEEQEVEFLQKLAAQQAVEP